MIAAIGHVGRGINFNPSKMRQKVVIEEDDEDDEVNKNKRIDVKRASAEILRKMEIKQRQDLKNQATAAGTNKTKTKSK